MNEPKRLVEIRKDGAVGVVRMVNHKSRNFLSNEMRVQLASAFARVAQDDNVRAIYLTGADSTFCAGGDLRDLKTLSGPWAAHQRFRRLGEWLLPLIRMDKPVVVGVNGVAVGGGMARAKQLLFGNATWTAQDALVAGFVAQVVADDKLDTVCGRGRKSSPMGQAESSDSLNSSWHAASKPSSMKCFSTRAWARRWRCRAQSFAKAWMHYWRKGQRALPTSVTSSQ